MTPDAPRTPTDAEMAEYVREHRCYNARRDITIADWDRGVRQIEAEAATPADSLDAPTTLWLDGTERADGYDPDQQLARRVERWLDDLVLHGALGTEDRRRIRLAFGSADHREPAESATELRPRPEPRGGQPTPADSLDALRAVRDAAKAYIDARDLGDAATIIRANTALRAALRTGQRSPRNDEAEPQKP